MRADEFQELYATSFARLVRQLYAMTGSYAEAQDCVQEAFIRAWQHHQSLDKDGSPEAWVRRTAYRLAVSRWRRVRRNRPLQDRVETPAQVHEDPRLEALLTALDRLPADQRRAVVLHHVCDLSVADIAAETGAPEGTVKARLSRGRAALGLSITEASSPTSPTTKEADHV
jgi:RNA polymerase sigma-70 factor (ECF subfamily)